MYSKYSGLNLYVESMVSVERPLPHVNTEFDELIIFFLKIMIISIKFYF